MQLWTFSWHKMKTNCRFWTLSRTLNYTSTQIEIQTRARPNATQNFHTELIDIADGGLHRIQTSNRSRPFPHNEGVFFPALLSSAILTTPSHRSQSIGRQATLSPYNLIPLMSSVIIDRATHKPPHAHWPPLCSVLHAPTECQCIIRRDVSAIRFE